MSSEVQVPEKFLYLKPAQVDELAQEQKALEGQLQGPNTQGADRGAINRRLRGVREALATQQAPDLNPEQRDAFSREEKRLREQWVQGMCSGEEMRKNPPGAVDKNLRHHRKNSHKISRWKNVIRALHKGDDSPNLSNIERFRPHTTPNDLSMGGAQIPGTAYTGTHPSEEYKAGHERIFGAPGTDPEPAEAAPATAKPSSGDRPLIAMKCGAMKDKRGRAGHERWCKACQSVTPAESV